jgi:arylsulfatase A-like enzyme
VLQRIAGRWGLRTILQPYPENDDNMNPGILRTTAAMLAATVVGMATLQAALPQRQANERPNIVWFVVDDMSADFSCYGQNTIRTPHVDRLAQQGLRFTRAYATSPVCSTFRSAMITGMYQTSLGAHHHRSGRGEHRIQLPDGVRPVPALFQKSGYYTCMGSGLRELDYRSQPFSSRTRNRIGKTDYNFDWDRAIYDSHDWSGRREGQPFFMQVQLHGGKLRGASNASYEAFDRQVEQVFGEVTDPESVQLPPYYPRDQVLLKDWSTYLDSVRMTDRHVGLVMERLRQEGLLANTLVVFFTDHGISHARGKQFLYDEGTHIPLVVSGPGVGSGTTRTDLVEHIDIAALSLAAAGIEIPQAMQGRNILASSYSPKPSVFAARDRCGEAADRIRSVRSEEYLYVKNFYPQRPLLMPSGYKDGKLIIQRLRELHSQGKLSNLSEQLLFAPARPAEELYAYGQDRWQTDNLAADPIYAAALKQHREQLERWIEETGDQGPETPEVYVLETEDQMKSTRNSSARETYRKNAELYKRWAREGK